MATAPDDLLGWLKRLEWSGLDCCSYPICAICEGNEPCVGVSPEHSGHKPDCELAAEIHALSKQKPASFASNIKGCARCGGDHPQLSVFKFERPFAPPELRFSWDAWATCPTNGDPILISTNYGDEDVARPGPRDPAIEAIDAEVKP